MTSFIENTFNYVGDKYNEAENYLLTQIIGGWTPGAIGDLSGKVALVTGGNSGIGFETCRKLCENGCHVYMVSRNGEAGEKAARCIRQQIGKAARIDVLQCDLSRLRNVVNLAEEFKRNSSKLDILINNAGVFHPGPYAKTEDGIEQTLAINYYAHALLTLMLLDVLKATPGSRVIMQSSIAQMQGSLDWNNLEGEKFRGSGMIPYGTSKMFLMMFAKELSMRVPDVDFFCTHPGVVASPLMQKGSWMYPSFILINGIAHVMGQNNYRGAYSTLYAATSDKLTGRHFAYLGPNQMNLWPTSERPIRKPQVENPHASWRLFQETVRVLRDKLGPIMKGRIPRHPDDHFKEHSTVRRHIPSSTEPATSTEVGTAA